jgi:site-specific DNA recombinase
MLLGMLGGTSKRERDLIHARVRDGMTVLAEAGERHLGGRPPYGYRLADAGEHPNAKKRALGQRLRCLEPDPVAGPVVTRIFEMFAAGQGLKQIANTLTAEGSRRRRPTIASGIGIVTRGGGRTRLSGRSCETRSIWDARWTDKDGWTYGPDDAQPALVDRDLRDAVQGRMAVRSEQRQMATRSPRVTTTPYLLRGLVHCGICERKMVGTKAHGIQRYRCASPRTRALPAYLADHPKALYVREDTIVRALDRWIPSFADAHWLAASQRTAATPKPDECNLHARLAEIDKATDNLVAAVEAGTDPVVVQPRIAQLRAEREQVVLERGKLDGPERLTAGDIATLTTELGGLTQTLGEATPPEKASIYQGLGLHLLCQPDQQALVATADLGRVFSRVGGGT